MIPKYNLPHLQLVYLSSVWLVSLCTVLKFYSSSFAVVLNSLGLALNSCVGSLMWFASVIFGLVLVLTF